MGRSCKRGVIHLHGKEERYGIHVLELKPRGETGTFFPTTLFHPGPDGSLQTDTKNHASKLGLGLLAFPRDPSVTPRSSGGREDMGRGPLRAGPEPTTLEDTQKNHSRNSIMNVSQSNLEARSK